MTPSIIVCKIKRQAVYSIEHNGVTLNNLQIVSTWECFTKLKDPHGSTLIISHTPTNLIAEVTRAVGLMDDDGEQISVVGGSVDLIGALIKGDL